MNKKELDKMVARTNLLQTELFDKTSELNDLFRRLGLRSRADFRIVKLSEVKE